MEFGKIYKYTLMSIILMSAFIFINREDELKILREKYFSKKAEFIIIYGRRRVGKTELVERFLKQEDIKGIRLLAREEAKVLQLRRFKEKLAEFFNDDLLKNIELKDWDSFFEYLSNRCKEERVVIAIDEFPYLVKEDKSLPSILQDYWDSKLRNTKIFLILLGSSVSMMEKLMGYKSPLYGRRTGQILLRPLKFEHVLKYIKDFKKTVEIYSIFGGTPAYLIEVDLNKNTSWNIEHKVLRKDSFIYRDVEFILREELDEPRYYFSILHSISKGNRKLGSICNDTGLSKSIVNKYLSVLIDLHFVKRVVPITESYKSKKGLYFIADNMFDFWFRFVFPYIDLIESYGSKFVVDNYISKSLNEFIGFKFEDIILELLPKLRVFNLTKIGKWWYKDKEIGIVALNEQTKEILFAECKWKENVDAEKIVEELVEKTKYVQWHNESRKEYLAVFAKSFSKRISEFEEKRVYCFDLKDLERVLFK
jgi:hypothetical protein